MSLVRDHAMSDPDIKELIVRMAMENPRSNARFVCELEVALHQVAAVRGRLINRLPCEWKLLLARRTGAHRERGLRTPTAAPSS